MRYPITPEITISKKIVFFLLFLFSMPLITAVIEDTQANIKIYSTTQIPKNGTVDNWKNIILRIEFTDNIYSGNTQNYTVTIYPNTTFNSNKDFTLFFIKNESVDTSIVDKYVTCLSQKEKCEVEKGKYDVAWNRCVQDLNKYEGENATSFKEELDTCSLLVKEKDLELTSQDDKITDLKNNEEGTKNSKYLWLIFGAVLAVVGTLLYQGKIGGGVAKEKAMGEFQKSQSG